MVRNPIGLGVLFAQDDRVAYGFEKQSLINKKSKR